MKLGAWMAFITIILVGLTIFGFDSLGGTLFNYIGIGFSDVISLNINSATFWITILGALTLLGVGGVVIGLFGKGYDPSIVIAGVLVTFGLVFISSFLQIYITLFSELGPEYYWMTNVIGLLFVGLGVGYVMATFDYFGGRTN